MTLNVTTVALDGETSAGDTLLVQADKLSTAAGAQLQSGKNLSIKPETHVLQVRRQHNRPWW
ncbi:TPA: hypothetical protein JLK93_004503 [Escherichia coli]|nr:hypothetical protein [Escherichia coli]